MSYYQRLLQNHAEIKKAMVETKGTADHAIWVNMYRWSLDEIKRHSTVVETASAK